MEAVAKLKNYPTSPRKMRLLADEIRGLNVEKAIAFLEFHPQHSSTPLRKLVLSAITFFRFPKINRDKFAQLIRNWVLFR